MWKVIVVIVSIFFGVFAAREALFVVIHYQGVEFQEQSVKFWGKAFSNEQYEKDANDDWGRFANSIMPKGGPLLSAGILSACEDSISPMVPVRVSERGELEVLCGPGSEIKVMTINIGSLQDEDLDLANMVLDALLVESGDPNGSSI